MFTTSSPPATPAMPTRSFGTWPRYNPPSSSPESSASSYPPTFAFTHQLSLSLDSTASTAAADNSDLVSSPDQASPILTTPFAFRHSTYAINPLASPVTPSLQSTLLSPPGIMGALSYPDTPSPPSAYGINGGIMVGESGTMLGSAPGTTATSCIRLVHPARHGQHHQNQQTATSTTANNNNINDPFLVPSPHHASANSKQSRPALLPTLSHNAVLQQRPSNASYRQMMAPLSSTSTANQRSTTPTVASSAAAPIAIQSSRPSTAGTAVQSTPIYSSQLSASAPSSVPISIPTSQSAQPGLEAAAPQPTSSSSHQVATSHTHPLHPHPASSSSFPPNTYSADSSFHTSSGYPYDTSFSSNGSNSPWSQPPVLSGSPHFTHQAPLPPPPPAFFPGAHPWFDMYGAGKQLEPILAPGEVPAPRPPVSYAALIGEALLLAPAPHHLYVSEISESIKKRYAYYRQNPSKIYNGVRHQTSMCKAFVKLPRPFGDQSGGARKWAIRAGCESWFQGGGYHPPGTTIASASARKTTGGKAKSTARSKQLAIGTASPQDKKSIPFEDAPWSPGPSAGPAYDGSGRPFYPFQHPQQQAPPPSYAAQQQFFPPGYHYMPIPHGHGYHGGYPSHPQPPPQSTSYYAQWGYQVPPPPALSTSTSTIASSVPASLYHRSFESEMTPSPEHQHWREDTHHQSGSSEHGSHRSFEDKPHSPLSSRAIHSPHGTSPEIA